MHLSELAHAWEKSKTIISFLRNSYIHEIYKAQKAVLMLIRAYTAGLHNVFKFKDDKTYTINISKILVKLRGFSIVFQI